MLGKTHPDIEWCTNLSKKLKLNAIRCPFTLDNICPRYYISRKVLKLTPEGKIKDLDTYWESKYVLWEKLQENPPTFHDKYPDNEDASDKHYLNFCPEVLYNKFGLFASQIDEYAIEYYDTERDGRSVRDFFYQHRSYR